jgi:hypothetical protein
VSRQVFVWHDDVHDASEGARLQFWRFAFVPDYDSPRIFRTLHGVFSEYGITSYVIYEALGEFDIVARLWVPRSLNPEDLALVFESELESFSLYQHQYILVQDVRLHWVWQAAGLAEPPLKRPEPEDLEMGDNSKVAQLANFNRQMMKLKDLRDSPKEPRQPEWVSDFVAKNLLRSLSLENHGVRFYITFDHPRRPLRRPEREVLAKQILERCRSVAIQTRSRPDVDADSLQLSLYVGSGPMTDFLIMARAPDGHFYDFARELVFGLHELELHRTHGMRTYTSVFADRHFAEFVENPVSKRNKTPASIVLQPESEVLEFKGSFAWDIQRWLVRDETASSDAVKDGVIKAICGLLNAPQGGQLVIGVLEMERVLDRIKDRANAFDKLTKYFATIPPDLAEDNHDPGNKVLIPITQEFADWDEFVRALNDTIRSRIDPNPLPYIDIERLEVEGTTLAVITCRVSPMWFYASTKGNNFEFFVRELAATRAYSGSAVDLYRRANPRQGILS